MSNNSHGATQRNLRTLRAGEMPFLSTIGYLFQITSQRSNSQLQSLPHTHDFYEIIFVLEGECTHVINDQVYEALPSAIHVLRPWDVHHFSKQSDNINLLVLSVAAEEYEKFLLPYGEFAQENIKTSNTPPVVKLNNIQRQDFISGYRLISSMGLEIKLNAMRILAGKSVQMVLAQMMMSENQHYPAQFLRAVELMRAPEYAAKGLDEFKRLTNYSHTHLCRLMKQYAGITPQQYVFQQRMNCAYEMLYNTDMDLLAVAESVGYSSNSHFCQVFHTYYGITPHALRKSARYCPHPL